MKYLIANWKANKNLQETEDWLNFFLQHYRANSDISIIICPPFPLIYFTKKIINNLKENVFLGSQNISFYENGSFTGEVTAATLQGIADYAIIGHSERRKYFAENDDLLEKKVQLAKKFGIRTIYCIRDLKDRIPQQVDFLAYEPVYAIGTGNNESLDKVLEFKKSLKFVLHSKFIYGGSIDETNAKSYLAAPEIEGLLIGTSSLNPEKFLQILNAK